MSLDLLPLDFAALDLKSSSFLCFLFWKTEKFGGYDKYYFLFLSSILHSQYFQLLNKKMCHTLLTAMF